MGRKKKDKKKILIEMSHEEFKKMKEYCLGKKKYEVEKADNKT